MHRIFALARVLKRCAEPLFKNPNNSSPKPKSSSEFSLSFNTLILPILGLVISGVLFYLTYSNAPLLSLLGGESILMPIFLAIAGLSSFFFIFIELVNTLYMSSDLSALIVLPYKPQEITTARLINCFMDNLPIALILSIPALYGYGIATGLPFFYFVGTFIGALVSLLFSVLLGAILIILIMSVFRIFRNRDIFTVIGTIFALFFIFSCVFFSDSSQTGNEISNFFVENISTLKSFSWINPIAPLMTSFYTQGNIISLLLIIVIISALCFLFYFLSTKLYLKGALSIHTGRTKSRSMSTSQKSHSTSSALFKKELYLVFHTPALYMDGFIMTFLWPILIIAPSIKNLSTSPIDFITSISSDLEGGLSTVHPYVIAVLCAFAFFVALMSTITNNLAYTAISREGSSFFFIKTIPVSYKVQLRAKRNVALLITAISTFILVAGATIYCLCFNLIPFWAIPLPILASLSTLVLANDFNLYLGAKSPNLDWTDITSISKSTSIGFIGLAFLAIGIAAAGTIAAFATIGPIYIILLFCALIPIATFFLDRLILSRASHLISNL